RNQRLEQARRLPNRLPGLFGLARMVDADLALAVIAEAPGLEDGRRSKLGQRRRQILEAVDRRKAPAGAALVLDEPLLAEPVLRHGQRSRRGMKRADAG